MGALGSGLSGWRPIVENNVGIEKKSQRSKETTISPARSAEIGVAASSSEVLPVNGTKPLEGSKTSAGLPSASGEVSTNLPSAKTAYPSGDIGNTPFVDKNNVKDSSVNVTFSLSF